LFRCTSYRILFGWCGPKTGEPKTAGNSLLKFDLVSISPLSPSGTRR
jgi:hypothetical protein